MQLTRLRELVTYQDIGLVSFSQPQLVFYAAFHYFRNLVVCIVFYQSENVLKFKSFSHIITDDIAMLVISNPPEGYLYGSWINIVTYLKRISLYTYIIRWKCIFWCFYVQYLKTYTELRTSNERDSVVMAYKTWLCHSMIIICIGLRIQFFFVGDRSLSI